MKKTKAYGENMEWKNRAAFINREEKQEYDLKVFKFTTEVLKGLESK